MKKIFKLLSLAMLVFLGACQDETEVGSLSFAPNVISLTPKDNGRQSIIGGFDVKMIVVDGPSSPLAEGTLSMTDEGGNVVFDVSKDFSGTRDSIVVDGETFDSEELGLGFYTINLTVTDTDGNETVMETTFELVPLPFVANQSQMYVAGEFNGWGSTPMELVATNTWEAKNIDLAGGKFKLKNRTDWSDTDWGDSDCDGTMAITSGGGPDTNCGYTGLVNLKFDDETLKYTITPAVTYDANLAGLFAFGNFNNFQGPPTYSFTLKADHQWELAEIRLKAGDYFKLFEMANLSGKNFGDAGYDGTAEQFGSNIVMPGGTADAFYKIVFNDQTLAYSITLVRYPFPSNLYLVGGSTTVGWNPGSSIQFKKTSEGNFEIFAYLTAGGGGFKLLQVQDWAGDWGLNPASAGHVIQEGEDNIPVAEDGFYRIRVNFADFSYSLVKTSWGIVGDATPGGWGTDTDMTFTGGHTWEIDVTLGAGEYKFRANDDWPINMGKDTDGTLKQDGGNIASPGPGSYHVKMILDPVTGYKYTITPN